MRHRLRHHKILLSPPLTRCSTLRPHLPPFSVAPFHSFPFPPPLDPEVSSDNPSDEVPVPFPPFYSEVGKETIRAVGALEFCWFFFFGGLPQWSSPFPQPDFFSDFLISPAPPPVRVSTSSVLNCPFFFFPRSAQATFPSLHDPPSQIA